MKKRKLGITQIGTYVPDNFISYDLNINKFQLSDDFLNNKIGTTKLSRKFNNEDTSDMCVKAFESLCKKHAIQLDEIECLILVTQNPDKNGIPHTSSIIHKKIGLNHNCALFDISLGCSGYVYGLSIIKSFMVDNNFTTGLLFTCDPYSKIIDMNDKNTSLLFGDAATVTLLTNHPKIDILDVVFSSKGIEGDALNNDDGLLKMNGRDVFNFSATEIPKQVKYILEKNNKANKDIDIFIFHQGSKFIIETLQRKLNIEKSKVPTNISVQGNTVSSSIPLLLENYIDNLTYNSFVISGFGVGLSWATAILNRIK
jgi:3-oxoacyl-[acyl-carrier-protein] synthase-3